MTVVLDSAPVKINGPLVTTGSHLVTFARIFVHDGRLFIAEGTRRGAQVTSVTEYPVPEGEPVRDPRKSRAASWGPWRWDNCGCGNAWGRHSVESLVAQAVLLEADPSPAADPPAAPDAESQPGDGSSDDTDDDTGDLATAHPIADAG